MFPHIADKNEKGEVAEPIFISAEHGDGLPDLYKEIQKRIPQSHIFSFKQKQQKRIERYNEYKKLLMDEFIDVK